MNDQQVNLDALTALGDQLLRTYRELKAAETLVRELQKRFDLVFAEYERVGKSVVVVPFRRSQ